MAYRHHEKSRRPIRSKAVGSRLEWHTRSTHERSARNAIFFRKTKRKAFRTKVNENLGAIVKLFFQNLIKKLKTEDGSFSMSLNSTKSMDHDELLYQAAACAL